MSEQNLNMPLKSNSQLNPQAPLEEIHLIPSLLSANSLNSDIRDNRNYEEVEQQQELQIVQNKSDQRINRDEIIRMFNEQLQKEEREKKEIELKRMESMKSKNKNQIITKKMTNEEKKHSKEQAQLLAQSEKSNRIKKIVEADCKKYKSMYRPSIYDTKLNRYRFENKEKLFFYLSFGIQELRELNENELSEFQKELVKKNAYDYCRKISFIIDLELVKILNKNDRQEIGREYKSQWETLLMNIKDDLNFELKRKILNRTFVPQKIALASDIDFFTSAKREEILEKQKRYIAEFTVQNVVNPYAAQQTEEIITEKPKAEITQPPKQEVPTLKPMKSGYANRYLEESSILQIEQLLSQNQLDKILKRLEEDLQGRSQAILIANFKDVFGQ